MTNYNHTDVRVQFAQLIEGRNKIMAEYKAETQRIMALSDRIFTVALAVIVMGLIVCGAVAWGRV